MARSPHDAFLKLWLAGGLAGSLVTVTDNAQAATNEYPSPLDTHGRLGPVFASPSRLERAFFSGGAGFANIERLPFWSNVLTREDDACAGMHCFGPRAIAMLEGAGKLSPAAQLERVNRFFNAIAYVDDETNWGVPDYWETPVELEQRGGDCEDYAVAKYFALRELGFSAQDLRIAVVFDEDTLQRHAVLMVHTPNGVVVLDNLSTDVRPAAELVSYRPLMAVNERNWWYPGLA